MSKRPRLSELLQRAVADAAKDRELLLAIAGELDGKPWNADTLATIADILCANGFEIRDFDEAKATEEAYDRAAAADISLIHSRRRK